MICEGLKDTKRERGENNLLYDLKNEQSLQCDESRIESITFTSGVFFFQFFKNQTFKQPLYRL